MEKDSYRFVFLFFHFKNQKPKKGNLIKCLKAPWLWMEIGNYDNSAIFISDFAVGLFLMTRKATWSLGFILTWGDLKVLKSLSCVEMNILSL